MLRSHSFFYKKMNDEVAIATTFVSGYRTRGRDTFFCSAKRKYPKKRRLDWSTTCAPRFLSGVGREGFLSSYRRAASMPRPFGRIPTKPAVLSAANESKTMLLRNISYNNCLIAGYSLSSCCLKVSMADSSWRSALGIGTLISLMTDMGEADKKISLSASVMASRKS